MKKNNRKWPLVLILFASMISVGMKNQNTYVSKAAEERKFEIVTTDAQNDISNLNSVENFEKAYPTPEGISWADGWSNANVSSVALGHRLLLGNLAGSNGGYVSLKLDNADYCVTRVIVTGRRFTALASKVNLYVNNKVSPDYFQSKDTDHSFDIAQEKTAEIIIKAGKEGRNQAGYISKIQVYYAANLDRLVNDITNADTCNEYNKAVGFRERYNYLTNADQASFNNTKISDVDQNGNTVQCTALEKLEYMEYLAATRSVGQNGQIQSITEQIKEKKSIGWIVIVGSIIVCISVYSVMIKRKWNKQR